MQVGEPLCAVRTGDAHDLVEIQGYGYVVQPLTLARQMDDGPL